MLQQVLEEGLDYYLEDGRYVFTAHYHQSRGYCCGNKCRHCPFEHEAVPKREENENEEEQ